MELDIESLSPRTAIGVGLLAVFPALWYAVGRPSVWGYVTIISTLIIVGSLYLAMKPIETGRTENTSNPSDA